MSRVAATLAFVACLAAGCAGSNGPSDPHWTEAQAASVKNIRGQPVRVRSCRGIGPSDEVDGSRVYRMFDCVAGTRQPWERYDTVAVFYVLNVLGEYEGPRSRHRLTKVRFLGGPGVA